MATVICLIAALFSGILIVMALAMCRAAYLPAPAPPNPDRVRARIEWENHRRRLVAGRAALTRLVSAANVDLTDDERDGLRALLES